MPDLRQLGTAAAAGGGVTAAHFAAHRYFGDGASFSEAGVGAAGLTVFGATTSAFLLNDYLAYQAGASDTAMYLAGTAALTGGLLYLERAGSLPLLGGSNARPGEDSSLLG